MPMSWKASKEITLVEVDKCEKNVITWVEYTFASCICSEMKLKVFYLVSASANHWWRFFVWIFGNKYTQWWIYSVKIFD